MISAMFWSMLIIHEQLLFLTIVYGCLTLATYHTESILMGIKYIDEINDYALG